MGISVATPGGRRREMIAERIEQLELVEVWYENDPTMRLKVNFPFFLGTGTKSTAVVYFELEPGHRLGTHTDSAEEVLLILEGEAEVSLGDEQGRLSAGEMALVPAMVPHGLRNVGDETVRVVGFFSSNVVVSTFDQPMMPFDQRVVGTPPVLEEEQVATGDAGG
ncbi:MAG TPA: cupin domain-containing protein [Rubrobacter sp.]|nr:cupin domain-containing protein [Rubrobacter sp.]